MAKTTKPAAAAPDDFAGVPGLGPVRKAALLAAGVTSQADLARASVDQIVGMTGLGRNQAEILRTFLQTNDGSKNESTDGGQSANVAGDEAMPDVPTKTEKKSRKTAPPAAAPESAAAEPVPDATDTDDSEFDRVLFAARTALSDGSRTWASGERLQKPFARLARRLETAEEKNNNATLSPGRRKRIQKRLVVLTDRMEKGAQKAAPSLSPKREKQLRERLQNESRVLAGLLAKPVKKQPAAPKPSFKFNKKAGN